MLCLCASLCTTRMPGAKRPEKGYRSPWDWNYRQQSELQTLVLQESSRWL